jgi:hypothetical protein
MAKFTEMLISEFKTNEERVFLEHYYQYFEYENDDSIYPIDLDNIWKLLGFSKKSSAKRHLEHFCTVEHDYKIVHTQDKKEKIMLNVGCFKIMCMTINTAKGKEFRQYFRKIEDIIFRYFKERNQAYLQQIEQDMKDKAEKEIHETLLIEYQDQLCLYLIRINKVNDIESILKIGGTNDILQSVSSLKEQYGDIRLLKVFPCIHAHKFEQYLLHRPDIESRRINSSELLRIDEHFSLENLVNIIEKSIDRFVTTMTAKDQLEIAKIEREKQALVLQAELIKALSSSKDPNSLMTMFNEFKNSINNTSVQDQPYQETKEPESNRRVYKYNPTNLKEPIAIFNSLREAARSLENNKIHDYHIRDAAALNTVVEGFRWYVIDNPNKNSLPEEIPNTTQVQEKAKPRNKGLVAKLNEDQTKIIQVFSNIQTAAISMKCAACTLTSAINTSRKSNGFYWRMYENCSEELKATYTEELPQPLLCGTSSKKVHKIDPETNTVIETFACKQDVANLYKISHKTLDKLNKTGEIYHNFKWKIIGPET